MTTVFRLQHDNKISDLIDLHRELGIALFGVATIPQENGAGKPVLMVPPENDGTSRISIPFLVEPGLRQLSLSVGELAKMLVKAGFQWQMRDQLNSIAPINPLPPPPPMPSEATVQKMCNYKFKQPAVKAAFEIVVSPCVDPHSLIVLQGEKVVCRVTDLQVGDTIAIYPESDQ